MKKEDVKPDESGAKAAEFAGYYFKVFSTPEGKRLLDHWVRTILMRPTVEASEPDKADGIREGRAGFVRGILEQIEWAKHGERRPVPVEAFLAGLANGMGSQAKFYPWTLAAAVAAGTLLGFIVRSML